MRLLGPMEEPFIAVMLVSSAVLDQRRHHAACIGYGNHCGGKILEGDQVLCNSDPLPRALS